MGYICPVEASWRQRLRYRVDTLLARGSAGPLIWLGAATILLTVIGALVFWLLDVNWDDRDGPAEALWQAFVIAIGKGVIGNTTWTQRIATLVFIFASLFLAGSLVGLLVSAINRRLDDLRRGRSRVLEAGHTLVLGASARLLPVLDELLADASDRGAIVVLAQQDKATLEDDLLARHKNPSRRVVFRNGTPSRRADLDLVGIDTARSVIVLNDGGAVDAVTVRRALAANSFSPDTVHIVAEMSNQRIARSVRDSTAGQVATVCIDATVADMLTQAIRSPGLAQLFDELLSFEGSEFYVMPAGPFAGLAWLDVGAMLADAVPLAILSDRSIALLPGNATIVGADDRIVVLATSATPASDPTARHQRQPHIALTDPTPTANTVMVLGWSHIGDVMLAELDTFLDPDANVVVLADESMIEGGFPATDGYEHPIEFRETKHDPDEIRGAIDDIAPDVLVVLGYLSRLSEDEADALTLLTLHTLGHAGASHHRPRIVAQMLNNEVGALARSGHADDYVVTDALVSRMLVHLARERELAAVFDDLFDAAGPSARLIACAPGTYRYHDLRMLVGERNMVLLGTVTGGGMNLNPPGDAHVTLVGADRLVVLGRFGAA